MLAPALTPYVASLAPYDVTMPGPGIHRGMPGTSLTFVLPLGEPLEVSWTDEPRSSRVGWSCISGLHTTPANIHHGVRQQGIQLALTAAGVRALLGVPLSTLAGELVELDDLVGELAPGLRHLPEELASGADTAARVSILNHRLVAALSADGAPGPRAEVGHALARLSRGAAVHDVADETGFSRRHLTNLVRAECGLAPKQFQRVARFERSRDRWRHALVAGRGSLADVAVACGFSDQAHLTREWRALAGCTPTVWAEEEFPFVQDTGHADRAG